jgi:hypothetical protein
MVARDGEFPDPANKDHHIVLTDEKPTVVLSATVITAAKAGTKQYEGRSVDTELGQLLAKVGVARGKEGSGKRLGLYEFPPLTELRAAVEREYSRLRAGLLTIRRRRKRSSTNKRLCGGLTREELKAQREAMQAQIQGAHEARRQAEAEWRADRRREVQAALDQLMAAQKEAQTETAKQLQARLGPRPPSGARWLGRARDGTSSTGLRPGWMPRDRARGASEGPMQPSRPNPHGSPREWERAPLPAP